MAISSPGIGSGLDVNSIISQLTAIERAPIAKLKTAATKIDAQVSIYGKIQSNLATLRDAAKALTGTATWGATVVASSNPAALTASVETDAAPGSYSVEVTQLAAVQSNKSRTFPVGEPFLAEGTLEISLGTWDPSTSTLKPPSTPISIDVGPPAQSLAQVAQSINNANAGVVASVLTDVNGSRLVVSSRTTGAASAFRIDVPTAGGLADLEFNPGKGNVMTAANAQVSVNGVALESATNTLSNVVGGLTLSLAQTTTAPVTIGVTSDTESMLKAVDAFVVAYNDVNKYLVEQTTGAVGKPAALHGDSAATSIRTALANLLGGTNSASGVYGRLSQIGLDPVRGGSIQVDTAKLRKAMQAPADVKPLFASTDEAAAGREGFGVRITKLADLLLRSDGLVKERTDALNARAKSNSKEQDRMSDRADAVEKRLRAQYTALDRTLGQLSGTSSYVTQQINAFNRKSDY